MMFAHARLKNIEMCQNHVTWPGSVFCFLEQERFTPQKVLVIPRNRWPRLNMTEKLFTGR